MNREHRAPPTRESRQLAREVALADLTFEECRNCAGTGYDDAGNYCQPCYGHGTIPVWSGSE